MVNIRDSTYSPLVSGTDLWHPSVWIAPGNGSYGQADPDSAGHYNDPALSNIQGVLALKLRSFWRFHDSLRVVVLGASRASDGVDPKYFTGLLGCNLAVNGGVLETSLRLARDYVLGHCPRLRVVVLDLGIHALAMTNDATWYGGIAQSKGYRYDLQHGFWPTGLPTGFVEQVLAQPIPMVSPPPDRFSTLGFVRFECVGWGTADISGAALNWTTADQSFSANYARILSLVDDLALRAIHLLVVNTPQNPAYSNSAAYGFLGPSQQTGREIILLMQQLESSNPYFHFYDAHQFGAHDYVGTEAFDNNHLCELGARKLSMRLDSVMHGFLE